MYNLSSWNGGFKTGSEREGSVSVSVHHCQHTDMLSDRLLERQTAMSTSVYHHLMTPARGVVVSFHVSSFLFASYYPQIKWKHPFLRDVDYSHIPKDKITKQEIPQGFMWFW